MAEPLRVFICYAHQDDALREALHGHLLPLKKSGLLEPWDDRQIAMGQAWEERLAAELERADVVLVLVSRDFIASEYAFGKELAKALERAQKGEATVVPIIVRPCLWREVPQLAELQAPRKGSPPRDANDDQAFTEIADAVRSASTAIRARREEEERKRALAQQEAARREAEKQRVAEQQRQAEEKRLARSRVDEQRAAEGEPGGRDDGNAEAAAKLRDDWTKAEDRRKAEEERKAARNEKDAARKARSDMIRASSTAEVARAYRDTASRFLFDIESRCGSATDFAAVAWAKQQNSEEIKEAMADIKAAESVLPGLELKEKLQLEAAYRRQERIKKAVWYAFFALAVGSVVGYVEYLFLRVP